MEELKDLFPIDHIGIAVRSVDEASASYQMLGFPQDGDDEIVRGQHVRVRAFRAQGSLLELLEPTSSESPIASFLDKKGPGLHHIAFRVPAIEPEIERLTALGARFINKDPKPGRAGSRVVFLHPKWSQGVLVELVEHH